MKKTIFCALMCLVMCFSALASADFEICPDGNSWSVCNDQVDANISVTAETEIVEVLGSVTGENANTETTLIASSDIEGTDFWVGPDFKGEQVEVGWQA